LKAVKAHTWLYPHRSLFRTPIADFEAQAKESVSHLAATAMGRSVSAQEPHHASYIPPSSSHLITHAGKDISPPTSPEIKSATLDPRRHTVQLEYDRPVPTIVRDEVSKPGKKVVVETPRTQKPRSRDDHEILSLGVPPAPALVRSATTGAAAAPRLAPLDTVEERPLEPTHEEIRRPPPTSVSGVAKQPTARPAMPHGSKPRPTSYHPPSSGGVSMSKGRSASGDRTANLLQQRRSSSGSSQKVFNEISPSAPISSYQNVEGEIVQSNAPPQETFVARSTKSTASQPTIEQSMGPPPQRTKSHKRASASISMVADKVFGFFTTSTKATSPLSSPQQTISENVATTDQPKSKHGMSRSNTTTRRTSVFGTVTNATVLSKKREKSNTPSKTSITRSVTEVTAISSPKSQTPEKASTTQSASRALTSEPYSPISKLTRSQTETHISTPIVEVYTPGRPGSDTPKASKPPRKYGSVSERGSTGAARRVMEFFRRRAQRMAE
jgi:hypothetical protein